MKFAGFFCVIALMVLFYARNNAIDMTQFQTDTKKVEIKGEVRSPGVYEVDWNATVADVLKEAGGSLENADISSINLSRNIENEAVIVVDKKQEEKKISINSATIEELDELPGLGPSNAQRIVEYRNHHSFQTLEDLKEVKGIGDKLFQKIKDRIML